MVHFTDFGLLRSVIYLNSAGNCLLEGPPEPHGSLHYPRQKNIIELSQSCFRNYSRPNFFDFPN